MSAESKKEAHKKEEHKKDDRRTNRTRRSLSQALIELILEKHYDEITVQDVIDQADVGRSTFYAHYRDKEDLLESNFEKFLDGLVHHIEWRNIKAGRCVPVMLLFRHLQEEAHPFYRALARSRKLDLLYKNGLNYLTKGIEQKLTSLLSNQPPPSVPISILSSYLAGELLGLLRWWLEHDMPYSPERMDEIFHALVMPGFRAALGGIELDAK